MTTLFDRRYRLRVNNTSITELDVAFSVKRHLRKEPNTAEITIHNLAPDARAGIEESGIANVTLEAGYKDRVSLIFAGDLRDVSTTREGADIITHITSGDGEKKHRKARINKSFSPGTSIRKVIKACAEAMEVGVGNLSKLTNVEFPKAGAVFPTGTVLSGYVSEELGSLLNSCGLEYSIQDGALQIVPRLQALDREAVLLTSESGLLGSPSVSSDGILRAEMLMIPDVIPGRKLKVFSNQSFENILSIQSRGKGRKHLDPSAGFSGFFRASNCEYTGDTASPEDWRIKVEAEPLFRPQRAA